MTRMVRGRITEFTGRYDFLSPYYTACVHLRDGYPYPSLMHAYVASRTTAETIRAQIRRTPKRETLDYYDKQLLPSDTSWFQNRRLVLVDLLEQKFTRTVRLANLLIDTVPCILYYVSDDRYLGCSENGETGKNVLGNLMVDIRRRLIRGDLDVSGQLIGQQGVRETAPERTGVLLREDTIRITGVLRTNVGLVGSSYKGVC